MSCLATLVTVLDFFFFFNDTATTEIYTLSLHDALPIFGASGSMSGAAICKNRGPQPTSQPTHAPSAPRISKTGNAITRHATPSQATARSSTSPRPIVDSPNPIAAHAPPVRP